MFYRNSLQKEAICREILQQTCCDYHAYIRIFQEKALAYNGNIGLSQTLGIHVNGYIRTTTNLHVREMLFHPIQVELLILLNWSHEPVFACLFFALSFNIVPQDFHSFLEMWQKNGSPHSSIFMWRSRVVVLGYEHSVKVRKIEIIEARDSIWQSWIPYSQGRM